MLLKEKEAYQYWLALHRDWPKVERLGLGQKIENLFLQILELTYSCVYLSPIEKIPVLSQTINRLDMLKFFCQLAWESNLITTSKYAEQTKNLEEIGRQLGAWKIGLIKKLEKQKLPPPDSDERNA